ncbi:hypothetical protein REPUB_Repub10bG0040900 [Reevesia pubescens]
MPADSHMPCVEWLTQFIYASGTPGGYVRLSMAFQLGGMTLNAEHLHYVEQVARIIANNIAKDLNLILLTKYGNWYDQKQLGGWTQSFGAPKEGKNETYLTFAPVRGAAHEVPFTSPSQALTLFHSFVNGTPLPRPSHD